MIEDQALSSEGRVGRTRLNIREWVKTRDSSLYCLLQTPGLRLKEFRSSDYPGGTT